MPGPPVSIGCAVVLSPGAAGPPDSGVILVVPQASLLANGILLHYSRSQETEADEYGAKFARAAGYDPKALISFFQTLQAQSGKQPGFMTWLSEHPATSDRIAHLQQYIAANHLSGGQLDLHGNALAQAQQALGPAPAATGGAGR